MKQQCHISVIYLSWVILISGMVFYLAAGNYIQAVFWLLIIPLALQAYMRYFPSISRFMGYGSVEDQPAAQTEPSTSQVTIYTAYGCPFCPIVKKRLQELQTKMGFHLKEIDITLKPELLISKGIRALPVVEVDSKMIVGNATSEQLASFIGRKNAEKA